MGIMKDLFQIAKMAKEMGMDISVGDLKNELLGDVDIGEIEASERKTRTQVSPNFTISDDDKSKYSEVLSEVYAYSDKETSCLFSTERAGWPVSNIVLASAGPFGNVIKSFLDEVEPLVGIISDQVKGSDSPIADSRNLLAALAYLEMICSLIEISKSGHRWAFEDGIAQAQVRSAWLDDYPNQIWQIIGWNYNDVYFEAYAQLQGHAMIHRLRKPIDDAMENYPEIPISELYNSGLCKLLENLVPLINFDLEQARKIRNIAPQTRSITNWADFLKEQQGFAPSPSIFSAMQECLDEVLRITPKEDKIGFLCAFLKAFCQTFEPPYSLGDMDLWRWFARITYDVILKDKDSKDLKDSLYHDPFEPEYGTSYPNQDVFAEINKYILWPWEVSYEFKDASDAQLIYEWLIYFQKVVLARHHYPTRTETENIEITWNGFEEHLNSFKLREVRKNEAVASGSYLTKIDGLVGIDEIKNRLKQYAALVTDKSIEKDLPPLQHMVFSGNPGTGKTTVAQILGEIFYSLGLLSKGHVVSVTRADLVAQYVGQTAPKVNSAIDSAMGGILFIDEAYTLHRDSMSSDQDSFGQEAIDALLTRMENDRGKFLVVAAGYPAEMQRFIDSNPGLASRFADRWEFTDYSSEELWKMFVQTSERLGMTLGADVESEFKKIANSVRQTKNFSNARWQRNLAESAQRRMASRIHTKPDSPRELKAEDLVDAPKSIEVSETSMQEIRSKLNSLVGLKSVKESIENLIAFQLLQKRRQEAGLPLLDSAVGHFVFAGPPGTGKTTIARLIGQIYKELGLLKSGHCVEVQRADLVAGYIGQTAIKTKDVISRSVGGILFIDEAYTLNATIGGSGNTDYGQEAIDTLLKQMEDLKGEFVVIVAGYVERMNDFLSSNPGLRSRFTQVLNFEPWTSVEFQKTVIDELNQFSLTLNEDATDSLRLAAQGLCQQPNFASGRTARTFREKVIESQARRLSNEPKSSLLEVTKSDIEMATEKLIIN